MLPHVSRAKSAQQIQGALVKQVLCARLGIAPSRLFHVSVAPCFDRKLEASRPQFAYGTLDALQDSDVRSTHATDKQQQSSAPEPVREVDLVLAAAELLELLRASDERWLDAPPLPADDLCAALRLFRCDRMILLDQSSIVILTLSGLSFCALMNVLRKCSFDNSARPLRRQMRTITRAPATLLLTTRSASIINRWDYQQYPLLVGQFFLL